MDTSISYYTDQSRISNSAIGWMIKKGPKYLRNMLDGKEEGLKGSFLEKGTMIHEYILQPEEFWKDYEILDFETPKVKQQKEFCDEVARLLTVNPMEAKSKLLLKAYRNAYSNSKTDTVALNESLIIADTFANYIKYLQLGATKKVISFSDLAMLKQIKKNLQEHIAANELLWVWPDIENHNEFHINWEHFKTKVKCKSLLDRIIIDTESKQLIIVDLKTTADVYNFKHSVEEYDYYRQIQFYINAAIWYLNNEKGITFEDLDKWQVNAYIIAIQSNGNNEVRVFNMLNKEELLKREDLIDKTLSDISYHTKSNNWEHTRKYYENEGIEQL